MGDAWPETAYPSDAPLADLPLNEEQLQRRAMELLGITDDTLFEGNNFNLISFKVKELLDGQGARGLAASSGAGELEEGRKGRRGRGGGGGGGGPQSDGRQQQQKQGQGPASSDRRGELGREGSQAASVHSGGQNRLSGGGQGGATGSNQGAPGHQGGQLQQQQGGRQQPQQQGGRQQPQQQQQAQQQGGGRQNSGLERSASSGVPIVSGGGGGEGAGRGKKKNKGDERPPPQRFVPGYDAVEVPPPPPLPSKGKQQQQQKPQQTRQGSGDQAGAKPQGPSGNQRMPGMPTATAASVSPNGGVYPAAFASPWYDQQKRYNEENHGDDGDDGESALPLGDSWGEEEHYRDESYRHPQPVMVQHQQPYGEMDVPAAETQWTGQQQSQPYPNQQYGFQPGDDGGFNRGSDFPAETPMHSVQQRQESNNQGGWTSSANAGADHWGNTGGSGSGHAPLPSVPHYAGGFSDYFRPSQAQQPLMPPDAPPGGGQYPAAAPSTLGSAAAAPLQPGLPPAAMGSMMHHHQGAPPPPGFAPPGMQAGFPAGPANHQPAPQMNPMQRPPQGLGIVPPHMAHMGHMMGIRPPHMQYPQTQQLPPQMQQQQQQLQRDDSSDGSDGSGVDEAGVDNLMSLMGVAPASHYNPPRQLQPSGAAPAGLGIAGGPAFMPPHLAGIQNAPPTGMPFPPHLHLAAQQRPPPSGPLPMPSAHAVSTPGGGFKSASPSSSSAAFGLGLGPVSMGGVPPPGSSPTLPAATSSPASQAQRTAAWGAQQQQQQHQRKRTDASADVEPGPDGYPGIVDEDNPMDYPTLEAAATARSAPGSRAGPVVKGAWATGEVTHCYLSADRRRVISTSCQLPPNHRLCPCLMILCTQARSRSRKRSAMRTWRRPFGRAWPLGRRQAPGLLRGAIAHVELCYWTRPSISYRVYISVIQMNIIQRDLV